MMRAVQSILYLGISLVLISVMIAARPPSGFSDNSQELDSVEGPQQVEEVRSIYYDLPTQPLYSTMPLEKLQTLYELNRRAAYLRSPSLTDMDDLYRMSKFKRQVKYRQCYFNPISCFKK